MATASVDQAVAQAWGETLPTASFDLDMTLEDAGADSLKTMHLVMRLEEALGRTIPLDILAGDVTPRRLAERLASGEPISAPALLPRMFLVPGVYGDAPGLMKFRQAFSDEVTLELLDLPGLDCPISLISDLAATTTRLGDELLRRVAPDEPISLIGWSFGGIVAFEIAHFLLKRNRRVDLLCVLDSYVGKATSPEERRKFARNAAASHRSEAIKDNRVSIAASAVARPARLARRAPRILPLLRRVHSARPHPRKFFGYALRAVFRGLIAGGWLESARRLDKRFPPPPHVVYRRRKLLLGRARQEAGFAWDPRPLPVPIFLIVTDVGMEAGMPAQWQRYCTTMRTVHVPCEHLEALKPAAVAVYKAPLVMAVHDVREGRWA